ncbi:ATP-binding protein [Planctobacterium marinum]|uniref:ATP-binding protein n=1 Tax=Planctobacterium marinum TaxID=1631968 RepID=UPI001E5E5CDA|nr:ATP-binding protein [Planctobacterium marinum]MCC2604431.1 response regulator [Planctobacterium marinum]
MTRESLQSHDILLFAVATLLACTANYFPIDFFTGSQLILGNVIAVAVTLLLGARYGIACCLISGLVTWFNWQHLYVLLPFAGEIAVIAYARGRQKSAFLFGIRYWFTAGWIVVAIQYFSFSDYFVITKFAITVKYIVNGIVNVMFGYVLAYLLRPYIKSSWRESLHFSRIIAVAIFIALTTGLLLNTFYWLKRYQSEALGYLQEELRLESEVVALKLQGYLQEHLQVLELAADLNQTQTDNWSVTIQQLATNYPDILTLLVTDKAGMITATHPAEMLAAITSQSTASVSVADRPYFYQVKANKQPFVSDVFQGRGFGNDPIVALSVPKNRAGSFTGILEASLNLKRLANLDRKKIHHSQQLLILDSESRIIFSSEELGFDFLQDMSEEPVLRHLKDRGNYYFVTANGEYCMAERSFIEGSNWQVISLLPRTIYEQNVASNLVWSLSILALILMVCFWAVEKLARKISEPIVSFSRELSAISDSGDFQRLKSIRFSSEVKEFQRIVPVIRRFAEKLSTSIKELETASRKAVTANKELEQLNRNLEDVVYEQTSELKHALEEAQQANKTKSEFLATMSHEIRTPMNGVLGMLELIELTPLTAEQKARLRVARSSAESLLSLINDILDFSKVDAGKIEFEAIEFDMIKLLSDVTEAMALEAVNKGNQLVMSAHQLRHAYVIGDPGRIRQVLTNILGNANKFTDFGDVAVIAHSSEQQDRVLFTISVKDTGIGIPDDKLATLFNPFTQADASTTRKFGGTGLGLSISQRLCQMMGGDISVASQAGEGSEFTITLPLLPGKKQTEIVDLALLYERVIYIYEQHKLPFFSEYLRALNARLLLVKPAMLCTALEKVKSLAKSPLPVLILIDEMPCSEELVNALKKAQSEGGQLVLLNSVKSTQHPLQSELNNVATCVKPVTPVNFRNAILGGENDGQQVGGTNEAVNTEVAGKRALLVEDNPINQEIALHMLNELKQRVEVAANGADAIEQLLKSSEGFDYILMDCQMPVMDGFEATQHIRSGAAGGRYRGIPIVALTANAMKGDKERCLAAGMNDYLSKPISIESLRGKIRSVTKSVETWQEF